MTVDSGRRTDSMAATTGSTRITIPAPPPYGRVVHRLVAAKPEVAQVVDAHGRETLFLDASGDALRQRPLDHGREERQDVDLEGHGDGSGRSAAAALGGEAAFRRRLA